MQFTLTPCANIKTTKTLMSGLMGVVLMVCLNQAWAATAPSLGSNVPYAITSSTLTNHANPMNVTGSICYTTAPATALSTVTGATTVPCPVANGGDQGAALAMLNGQTCVSLGGGAVALNTINLGSGLGVFTPGCYSSGGAMSVDAGTVTLTGAGVYIFRSGGTLTSAVNTSVAVAGGACETDVFWVPNAAATLGANTSFVGNIMDGVANAVTLGSGVSLVGRILSYAGVVTVDANTITTPSCTPFGSGNGVAGIPTLSEGGVMVLSGLLYARRRGAR